MADLAKIKELAAKWLNGTITEAEKQVFEDWYNNHPDVIEWTGEESRAELKENMLTAIMESIGKEEFSQEVYHEPETKVIPIRPYRKIFVRVAAVAAVLLLSFGVNWLVNNKASLIIQ